MLFNWKLWLKGLYAAAIGGASTVAANAISDPAALSKPKELLTSAAVGAAVTGLGYLKTHPPVDELPADLEPFAVAGIGAAATKIEQRLQPPQ